MSKKRNAAEKEILQKVSSERKWAFKNKDHLNERGSLESIKFF